MPDKPKSRLTLYIAVAIVLAILLAVFAPGFAMQFELGGEIFLNLLTMMVVPLVMASVMSGIIGLGDIRKLGRPGGLAVTYYLMTTVLAVIVGLLMVNLIQPGVGVDQTTLDASHAEGQVSTAGREDAEPGNNPSGLGPDALYRQPDRVGSQDQPATADFLLDHLCRNAHDNGPPSPGAYRDNRPSQTKRSLSFIPVC